MYIVSQDYELLLESQGDGISRESMSGILDSMEKSEWSVDNVVFGSGGALLQKFNRDTAKFAYKACHAVVDGKPVKSCPVLVVCEHGPRNEVPSGLSELSTSGVFKQSYNIEQLGDPGS